jgi:hypothetical protein
MWTHVVIKGIFTLGVGKKVALSGFISSSDNSLISVLSAIASP